MKLCEAMALLIGVAIVALATAPGGAPRAGFQAAENPDVIEIRQYVLTLDKAQKTAKAMFVVNRLVQSDPSLNAAMDAGSSTTGRKPRSEERRVGKESR